MADEKATKKRFKEPKISDRGFASFPPINDLSGSVSVKVFESSNAVDAAVWLGFEADPSFDAPGGASVAAQLSLEQCELVRDQLTWFLTSHYHRLGES